MTPDEKRLPVSQLCVRLGVFVAMALWSVDKISDPGNASGGRATPSAGAGPRHRGRPGYDGEREARPGGPGTPSRLVEGRTDTERTQTFTTQRGRKR